MATDRGLRVVVDGAIFGGRFGGISRVFSEVLPRMCDQDASLRIRLLTEGALQQVVPCHDRIEHRRVPDAAALLRPNRLWKPLVPRARAHLRRRAGGSTPGAIWQSTFFTAPDRWRGPQVLFVADMIHERFADHHPGPYFDELRARKARCIARADVIVCISETTVDDLHRYATVAPTTPVLVASLGPSEAFRELGPGNGAPPAPTSAPHHLLYLGSRGRYKNFGALLDALSCWPQRDRARLSVVGAPPSADEQAQVGRLGLVDRVEWLGPVDDERLCRLYHRASALVYPSEYEGFGLPLVEAMATGCPIVASDIPSTREVAGDGPAYFALGDRPSLAAALDRVMGEGRRSPRTAAGLERVRRYSWDRTAATMLEAYRMAADVA